MKFVHLHHTRFKEEMQVENALEIAVAVRDTAFKWAGIWLVMNKLTDLIWFVRTRWTDSRDDETDFPVEDAGCETTDEAPETPEKEGGGQGETGESVSAWEEEEE